jgi:hypothetical protein
LLYNIFQNLILIIDQNFRSWSFRIRFIFIFINFLFLDYFILMIFIFFLLTFILVFLDFAFFDIFCFLRMRFRFFYTFWFFIIKLQNLFLFLSSLLNILSSNILNIIFKIIQFSFQLFKLLTIKILYFLILSNIFFDLDIR